MDDLQAVNNIISHAVENSSYTTVLISSGVFIIYTIIVKLVEIYKTKSRNKPFMEMADAVKKVSENVVKLNQVLDKTIQDAETKEVEQIKNVISTAFTTFKSCVLDNCIDVIVHNNIASNKEDIKSNLYRIVSTEYYKLYSIFSTYEHDSVNVATKIKEDWIATITDKCLEIIYNQSDSLNKIRQLNNKLNILSAEFSVYMTNKVLNH